MGSEFELTGKIDLELEVLTATEALLSPAGKAREEPDGLPVPMRPATSFNWIWNPIKTLRFIVWKKMGKALIVGLILFIVVFFILITLYSFPNYLVKKLLKA